MNKPLVTSKGTAVTLGQNLGRGGEGSVFELPTFSGQVAKIYHKVPDEKKQAKLSYMASTADPKLLKYVAWPQETLHSRRGGPVIGFLMPKLADKAPIHMVYSPAHRRQEYPKVAWDFLLFVSRNIAASFETIHDRGHVIGDVNQNSFMVGRDSTVVLIDSDSFQINAKGTMHLCKVGVSHFTPPELQTMSSFGGFTRTTNHDNFGLALLIFHILFGGRHPYSGVPLRRGVGETLESDIKNFRYAYARDNQTRGISPPPRSIPISMLPEAIETMFRIAFTERGVSSGRPTASQWIVEIDRIRENLKKCPVSTMHIYPVRLAKCPWCALEQQGVVYFIDLGARTFSPISSGFVISQVWGLIQAISAPPTVIVPSPSQFNVKVHHLPDSIPGKGIVRFYRLIAVVVAVAIILATPGLWILALLAGGVGWIIAGNAGSSARAAEKKRREDILTAAQLEYNQLVDRLKKDAGPEGFHAQKAEYKKLRRELEHLPQAEKQEIDNLRSTAHERQKLKFLGTCFIENATIPQIGPARKASLRSFGIETAADVTRNRVMQVSGFGKALTQTLLDWKTSCERRFTFNPAAAVSEVDHAVVRSKYATKRATIEQKLSGAPAQLQQFRQRAATLVASQMPQLKAAAKKLRQAQVDLSIFS